MEVGDEEEKGRRRGCEGTKKARGMSERQSRGRLGEAVAARE